MKRLVTLSIAIMAASALSAGAADAKVQDELKDAAAFKAIKDGLKDKDGKKLMGPAEGMSDDEIKGLVAYMRKFKK